MRNTRKKILETALDLFNAKGTPNVSQRDISDMLDISPGNLTYHFKKKEDIETELYFSLVKKIDHELRRLEHVDLSLALMVQLLDNLLLAFFNYRFIFMDFVHIMRNNNKIAGFHLQLSRQRKEQFTWLIQRLISNGIFRSEELENEYEYLYERMAILSDFWIAEVEVSKSGAGRKDLSTYRTVIVQGIYPYLTNAGREEYREIFVH